MSESKTFFTHILPLPADPQKAAAKETYLMRALIILLSAMLTIIPFTSFAGDDYTVTITNQMKDELLAPVLIAPAHKDKHIFDGAYVTKAAEHQILTGDPAMLKEKIGRKAMVGHGSDGPPGVLLAPGKSIKIEVRGGRANVVRIIAMVAPTKVPDNYVSGLISLGMDSRPITLDRYDIGHDEGRKTTELVSAGAVLVTAN